MEEEFWIVLIYFSIKKIVFISGISIHGSTQGGLISEGAYQLTTSGINWKVSLSVRVETNYPKQQEERPTKHMTIMHHFLGFRL